MIFRCLSIFLYYYLTWFKFVANANSTDTCPTHIFWCTWMSFLSWGYHLGVGLWSVRNVHLSHSSRGLEQFRILLAVGKSLYLCFKIKVDVPIWWCFCIVSKIAHKEIFILWFTVLYTKCHLISHFLFLLGNCFPLCVHAVPVYKRFEAIYWPSLTNCQASCHQLMAASFNSFLFCLPRKQELNSRLRCRKKFGLIFPLLFLHGSISLTWFL